MRDLFVISFQIDIFEYNRKLKCSHKYKTIYRLQRTNVFSFISDISFIFAKIWFSCQILVFQKILLFMSHITSTWMTGSTASLWLGWMIIYISLRSLELKRITTLYVSKCNILRSGSIRCLKIKKIWVVDYPYKR